jgi:putative redox protein
MTITVTSQSASSYRHTIQIAELAPLFTDMPSELGGESSAPDPHDYFDTALGACKALTVTQYARARGMPLTGIEVAVSRDNSKEREGHYTLNVTLTLQGDLSEEQRAKLLAIADKCPVHKLMTSTEIHVETKLG